MKIVMFFFLLLQFVANGVKWIIHNKSLKRQKFETMMNLIISKIRI